MQGFFQTHVDGVCAVESDGPQVAAVLGVYPVPQVIVTPPHTERLDVASTDMAHGLATGHVTAIPVAVAVWAIQTPLIQHDPSAHAARLGPQETGGAGQAEPAVLGVQIPFVQQVPSAQAVEVDEQVFTGGGTVVPSQLVVPEGTATHAPFIQHGLSTVQARLHTVVVRGATVEGAVFVAGASVAGATVAGATVRGATVEGAVFVAGAAESQESALDFVHCPLTQHNVPVEEMHCVLEVHD
jgi:hypothetical protein